MAPYELIIRNKQSDVLLIFRNPPSYEIILLLILVAISIPLQCEGGLEKLHEIYWYKLFLRSIL